MDISDQDVYVFPASFAQRRMWFLDQFQPGCHFYNIPMAVRIKGALRVPALELGIQEIFRRHESLRTTFAVVDGEPVQVIHKDGPGKKIALERVDLRRLSAPEREAEIHRRAMAEAQLPFNLAEGPLLRATLLKLGERDHALLLTMHHIVSDAWSQGVFMREMAVLYDAFSGKRPSPLPDLPLQYADFTEWQREWLQGEVMEAQLDYWRGRLGDNPPPLRLPTDYPRPPVQTTRGAKLSRSLPKPLANALQELSRREGATLFMTLLAAFQVLLHRYTGQDDISVGTPVANRTRAEIEGVIGCFINTLVMRTDLSGDPSFRELLQRAREVALSAYTHQDLPFEKLVEELNPERDMSRPSLFQVMLILQNTPREVEIAGHGLILSALKIDKGTSNFDLTLTMVEEAKGLNATAEYNTDLFEAATIERLLQRFQTLLEGVVANPDQRISTLPLLPEAEKQRLLVEWNGAEADYPLERCVHQLFEAQVERAPDAVAVVWRESCLTYGALNQRANQLAHYLRELDVGPETLVGICVERSLEMVVGALAALKAGGAYVPLDPAYPEERLRFMLNDAQAAVLLTQERLVEGLRITDCGLRIEDWRLEIGRSHPQSAILNPVVVRLDSDWELIARESEENPNRTAAAGNLAYVIYTSGSTGQSKGVMVRHDSLINAYLAWEKAYELGRAATCHLQMASFPFDVCSGDMLRALCSGGKLVICPRESLLAAEELYALMRGESVDCAEFVPAVMRNLLAYLEETGESLDFMRVLVVGSDTWYASEYQKCLRLCGAETRLINSFGLTEATIDSTYFDGFLKGSGVDLPAERSTPIGRPFTNTRIYVLDAHLQPAPIGVYGEIFVGGPGVTRGYHGAPDLTAEKFIPNPFSKNPFSKTLGARLYKTGDLARYLPSGDIEFAGRCDDQVKIRGFRVEIGEVEAVLGEHPNLRQVAAVVREDQSGERRLAAYFVPACALAPTPGELRRFLLEKLPEYLVPSSFTRMDDLPLTPNGKIDRRALPSPEPSRRESDEDYVAPRTPIEEMLAGIWGRVLNVGTVGIHDNFFAIGGHSLLATRVNSQLRDAFQVELPLRNIFEFPTIAGLAEKVEIALAAKTGCRIPPLLPVPRDQDLPLSFAQERLWFLHQLTPGSASYNIAETYRLSGPLKPVALEQSLNEVVRRHEVLRTTFAIVDARPVQVIAPELRLSLPVVDLSGLSEAEREGSAERLAAGAVRQPFDLALGPLLRVMLLRLGEEEHAVLLTIHHIVSDYWSTFVYLREIAILYDAFTEGRPSPLPELPVQYADYAHWQRQWLQGEALETQLSYWKRRLAGAPPMLKLPTDRPRPAVKSSRGESKPFVLPRELSDALKELSRREGATLFMTMLAAFQTLLHRYTGEDDISVGSPITNRSRSEIEGLIGFFVNAVVLRADLSGDPSFRELLGRIREVALGAYAHQDLPFEKLVQELQPERDLSRTPLFQVMLAMQNIPMQAPELARQGLSLSTMKGNSGMANFDLTLFVTETIGGLSGELSYSTDIFDDATIARMLKQFRNLLEAIASDPDRRIAALPLLTKAEEQQLLREWNRTQARYSTGVCVHQLFEKQAERAPDAVAIVGEEDHLTYGELNRRANQLAHYLLKHGAGPETPVAVCVERSSKMASKMVLGLLGILKAGAAFAPLDPAYPEERLTFVLNDVRAPLLLTQERLVEELRIGNGDILSEIRNRPPGRAEIRNPVAVCLDSAWEFIAMESTRNPVCTAASENLAYVIYTSGSTGAPKGTPITHGNLGPLLRWSKEYFDFGERTKVLQNLNYCFDFGVFELLTTVLFGGTLHFVDGDGLSDFSEYASYINRHGINTIHSTPSFVRSLLSFSDKLESLETIHLGGEPLTGDLVDKIFDKVGGDCVLYNGYGPTEATINCSIFKVGNRSTWIERALTKIPIGKASANNLLYILDKNCEPVPIGVPGELYVGGVGLTCGYLNRTELTAERFVPNSFSHEAGARLYKTGDLVRYLPDGNIEFLDRSDHQVKIRGFRVELGEIEAVLSRHEAVRESVVIAREDIPGDKRLVAYYVALSEGRAPTHGELRNSLKERLPDYMIPSVFIELETLPLTPNGKVDRRALPAPDKTRPELKAAFVTPRTTAEGRLAAIWVEVLGLEQVGVHDHFFELGGHSLLAAQVVSRVRQVFEIELPLRSMFETPTVAGLAEEIETILWVAKNSQAPADAAAGDREEGEI